MTKIATCLTIKINNWEYEENPKGVNLLSPVKDIEGLRLYIDHIKGAVDNHEAHNIALTGTYGSGN